LPHALLEGATDLRRGRADARRSRAGASQCLPFRRDRQAARRRRAACRHLMRRSLFVASFLVSLVVACTVARAPLAGGGIGATPDIGGLSSRGYLGFCKQKTQFQKEWT